MRCRCRGGQEKGEEPMKKQKTPIEKFLSLSDAQKDAYVARFDREIPLSETRPLNHKERKLWRAAKKKMGRPVVGQGAKTIAVTMERGLLRRVDRYARRHDLKRAQIIAQGIEMI